jgi:hypothetical protein
MKEFLNHLIQKTDKNQEFNHEPHGLHGQRIKTGKNESVSSPRQRVLVWSVIKFIEKIIEKDLQLIKSNSINSCIEKI